MTPQPAHTERNAAMALVKAFIDGMPNRDAERVWAALQGACQLSFDEGCHKGEHRALGYGRKDFKPKNIKEAFEPLD